MPLAGIRVPPYTSAGWLGAISRWRQVRQRVGRAEKPRDGLGGQEGCIAAAHDRNRHTISQRQQASSTAAQLVERTNGRTTVSAELRRDGRADAMAYPAMRTGSEEMPRMKPHRLRFGSSIISTTMSRFRISSHRIPSCISASRLPTQRWMPKPNEMLPRTRAVDDEFVGPRDRLLVAVARHVPHDDFVALADLLPPISPSASAVRRMCMTGVCQRMISGTRLGTRTGSRAACGTGPGLVQRPHAAGDRIARRLVAANDQQREVAEIFLGRRSCSRRRIVRQHRDEIDFGAAACACRDSFVKQSGLQQYLLPLRHGMAVLPTVSRVVVSDQ